MSRIVLVVDDPAPSPTAVDVIAARGQSVDDSLKACRCGTVGSSRLPLAGSGGVLAGLLAIAGIALIAGGLD